MKQDPGQTKLPPASGVQMLQSDVLVSCLRLLVRPVFDFQEGLSELPSRRTIASTVDLLCRAG